MPVAPGSRLGPYEITAKLGEGGMGEVYRATDTKLKREVAIKVLPAAFTEDRERLARFEREAQLLAQLHHPNIASIFGMEESGGTRALVMELVEGLTLADRLAAGALPVDEALAIARQIAEALEEAHEKGIVHRDLKPQNVKVTAEGKVKVLDFGLAKAMDPLGAASGPSTAAQLAQSPTLTLGATQMGVVLGTAAYMSPEQAKGHVVDRRADIWAFGVVTFEMLSGRRLFEGDSVPETLAGVLRNEIDLASLPAGTPPAVRQLLRRCLERDPKRRLRDIGDARLVLEDARDGRDAALGGARTSPEPVPAPPVSRTRRAASFAAAVGALVVAGLAGRATRPATPVAGEKASFDRFTQLTFDAGLERSPALSPDGQFVVYAAVDGGDLDLFLLRVGGQRAINLTADSPLDDDRPAYSPDGRSIAFRSERDGGGLFVMGATGESVRKLTGFGDEPAWSPDGRQIVFATEGDDDPHAREKNSELWVIPAAGGEPRRIFAGDAVHPSWSPDGRRIAFWAVADGVRDVWTIAADGTGPVRVTNAPSVDWNPVWGRDGRHLYFESDRGGVMVPWRVEIDSGSGRVRGEPEQVVLPTAWSGQLSFSADESRLAFRTSNTTAEIRRIPFDPARGALTGPVERLFDTAIPATGLDLSPDGWLLFRTNGIQEDVYMVKDDGSGLRKLTDDPAKDRGAVWSPDGQTAAFYSNRGGRYEIWTVRRDGSDLRARTRTDRASSVQGVTAFPVWSPDGRSLALGSDDRVVVVPLRDDAVPLSSAEVVPIEAGATNSQLPISWSPDGKRLAAITTGTNGELSHGIYVYDFARRSTRFVRIDFPPPTDGRTFPNLAWLPDSRRGVVRWGERILRIDAENGEVVELLGGFHRAGGHARLAADGRFLYMLDSDDQGDVWLAERSRTP